MIPQEFTLQTLLPLAGSGSSLKWNSHHKVDPPHSTSSPLHSQVWIVISHHEVDPPSHYQFPKHSQVWTGSKTGMPVCVIHRKFSKFVLTAGTWNYGQIRQGRKHTSVYCFNGCTALNSLRKTNSIHPQNFRFVCTFQPLILCNNCWEMKQQMLWTNSSVYSLEE